MKENIECPYCMGAGVSWDTGDTCNLCKGSGKVSPTQITFPTLNTQATLSSKDTSCEHGTCDGSGVILDWGVPHTCSCEAGQILNQLRR